MDELQILRTRCGEMAAEIERLQSVIDEANAWKPSINNISHNTIPAQQSVDRQTIIDILVASGNLSEGVTADIILNAIGAQQSPAVDGEWSFGEDNDGRYVENNGEQVCYCASETNARYIAEVMGAKSPAVAVPDCHKLDALIDELRDHMAQPPHLASEEFIKGCLHALDILKLRTKTRRELLPQSPRITEQDDIGAQLYEEMQDAIHPYVVEGLLPWSVVESWELIFAHWIATKDGRVTEQDAIAILVGYGCFDGNAKAWAKTQRGRALLDKLNKPHVYVAPTATGNGSGSDPENCISFGDAFAVKPDSTGGLM